MRKKLYWAGLVTFVTAIAVASCGGGGGGAPAQISMEAQDIKWSTNAITASVGQSVEVTIANTGALEHNFSIDALGVNRNVAIGATETVTFTPSSAGSLEFYCATPGHREAGMVGTLTVNP